MPKLALAQSFLESFKTLDKDVAAGVCKAAEKFHQLSLAELYADKGLHLESVEKSRDPRMRTIRVTKFWRGVVLAPDDGSDTFLLLNVLPHEDTYSWAAKRLYTVNAATHGLEVRNVEALEQLAPTLETEAASAPSLLFAAYSATELRALGIDEQVLRAARTIINKPQLEAFSTLLPEDQFEVLSYLAEGFSVEEVERDIVLARRPSDAALMPTGSASASVSVSLERAIANTKTRITVVSSTDELTAMLDKPFALWRVFLHASQRRVAYRPSYAGPAQVTGGPGTGKTVVALHRVKHLLSRSPDSRILLTTFTNALADSLRENLTQLLGSEAQLDRVEVTTVNAFAHRTIRTLTSRVPAPIGDADEARVWKHVRKSLNLAWTEQFLAQELRHVLLAQDVTDLAGYLAATRRGRGIALTRPQREQVWRAMEMFGLELGATGRSTHLQVCAQAARLLADADLTVHGFDHVVVDEAQDLHPAQWRVLRAAVPPGPDDLFIVGDPHQQIYDSRVSLTSLGIPVVGRSSRLRINYRSTEEILTWSVRIMRDVVVDDLQGEQRDSLHGYLSLLHGTRPVAAGFQTQQEEVSALVEQVQAWLDTGTRPQEIAVCARFNLTLDKVANHLSAAKIPYVRVKDRPAGDEDAVRLATMHAMKGLEFRCVAVVGAGEGTVPFAKEITPVGVDRAQHDSDVLRERCLFFVACTRARESLRVSWAGTPSPFLPGE